MEKINDFLNKIYGNGSSSMTFYIILGVVALFFIVLIIVTLSKGNKTNDKEIIKDEVKDNPNSNIETNNEEEEDVQDTNTLTMKLNLSSTENEVKTEEVKEEPAFEEKKAESIEEPVIAPEEIKEDVYIEKPVIDGDMMDELPKETPYVPEEPKQINKKPIVDSEITATDMPTIESTVVIDKIGEPEVRDDYTIEMPKIKPIDLEDYIKEHENK